MVFDLSYPFKEEFYGVQTYMTALQNGKRFGIWIFRCGKLVNLKTDKYMGGDVLLGASKCYKYEQNEVTFYSDNCPSAKYLKNNSTTC